MTAIDIETFRLCMLAIFIPGCGIFCLLVYATIVYWYELHHDEMSARAYEETMAFPHRHHQRTLVHGVLYIVDRPLPMSMGVLRDISFVPTSTLLQSWLRVLVGFDGDCAWRTKQWMKS